MGDEEMKAMVCDQKDVGLEEVKSKWEERWKEGREGDCVSW
jgi:hypothetical protein